MSEPPDPNSREPRPSGRRDYQRTLGVVECFTVVTEQCPSGAVRAVAERALEAAKGGGPGVLRDQAWFVLTAIQGWRGERAAQVHRSLTQFLESTRRKAEATPAPPASDGSEPATESEEEKEHR